MALGAVGKKESLSEQAYRMLRGAILDGELRPGAVLTEEGVAELLQISRTPVRSALQQLMLEGLLKAERKNLVVSAVGAEELRDIDQVRAELEPLSAELNCIRGLDDKQTDELLGYCRAQKQAAAEQKVREFFQAGENFHIRLAQFSGNQYLADMIIQASEAAVRYLVNQEHPEQFLDASGEEHETILQIIRSGDAEQARIRMKQHIQGK
jgi:DNA-binding GntR family transcriptional regulator